MVYKGSHEKDIRDNSVGYWRYFALACNFSISIDISTDPIPRNISNEDILHCSCAGYHLYYIQGNY